jgi:hypothetical protein
MVMSESYKVPRATPSACWRLPCALHAGSKRFASHSCGVAQERRISLILLRALCVLCVLCGEILFSFEHTDASFEHYYALFEQYHSTNAIDIVNISCYHGS